MSRYVPQQQTPDFYRLAGGAINYLIQRKRPVKSVTAAYTIDGKIEDVDVVLADATSAAFTVTLPPANPYAGVAFTVKKTDASANAVTVDGAETIDGAANYALAAQYDAVTVISNGTAWHVI